MGYDAYVADLERVKELTADDVEYWRARDLHLSLGYDRWESFSAVVERSKVACESSGQTSANHFHPATKMVSLGSGARRATDDWFLSRYACYLIAMNADSSKAEVGFAQTYFAYQTRRQEQQDQLTDMERRRQLRGDVTKANKELNNAAKNAGVLLPRQFVFFHSAGYKGLYGMGVSQIKEAKGIGPKEQLLDRVGRAELAANYFRITQTEQRLRRADVREERAANQTHYTVGQQVRRSMQDISGTRPEDLPAAPSLKKLKAKRKKKQIDGTA